MRSFYVLLVEDDEKYLNEAKNRFLLDERIKLEITSDPEIAKELLKKKYFNIAIIDIKLRHDDDSDTRGLALAKYIADYRKSCKRVIVTKYHAEFADEIFIALDPQNRFVDGAINKLSYHNNYLNIIKEFAEEWVEKTIEIDGSKDIFELLINKGVKSEEANITIEEIEEITAKLFEQTQDNCNGIIKKNISSLSISVIPGGRSKSVVAITQPKSSDGIIGIWCVIKYSNIDDAIKEYIHYCDYVKYFVSLNRRVELLGFELGDTIGAICYSFAGSSPSSVTSLEALFKDEDETALSCLEKLFNIKYKEWYAREGISYDLAGFFGSNFDIVPNKIFKDISQFAQKMCTKTIGKYYSNTIQMPGYKLILPTEKIFGMGNLRENYKNCIVHGDAVSSSKCNTGESI